MEALAAWLNSLDFAQIISHCILTGVVVVIGLIVIKIGSKVIRSAFSKVKNNRNGKRADTLATVFCSLWRYFVYFITAVIALSIWGVSVVPVLASAGVVGVAIGFGAQSLVKDVISGFFLLFENYYDVGDYVCAGGVQGFVEEVGLRSTKIKDWDGSLHIYPNGQVTVVTNYSRGDVRTVLLVPISCEIDLNIALAVLKKACQEQKQQHPAFHKGPTVQGLERIEQATMLIRISFWSQLEDQFDLEMSLRNACKTALDHIGMAIPYVYSKLVMEQETEMRRVEYDQA